MVIKLSPKKKENIINDDKNIKDQNLTDLINRSNKLVKLLYFLLVVGIILTGVIIIKEIKIVPIILQVLKVLSPLFIGFILAWLFNPLVKKLHAKGIPKALSAILIYIVFILFVFLFIRVFIPVLYKQLNDLIVTLPNIVNDIIKFFDDFMVKISMEGIDLSGVRSNIVETISSTTLSITSQMPGHILNFTKAFFSGMGTILFGLVVGIYMLIDFDHISEHFVKFIPSKYREEVSNLINNIGIEVRKTVNGTLLVALMVLVLDTIAFNAIGLSSPLLFGVLCGLTDLIPYIGPYIGGAAAVIVGFSQSTTIGIMILITCIVVQLIENYVFQPVVMSKATQLHPVTIIIGLLLFGHFFGIAGMILATPILAILKVIYEFICTKFNLFAD